MRLLFDQNLLPQLVSRLRDLQPGAMHVDDVAALFQQRHTEVLEFSTNVDGALLALT